MQYNHNKILVGIKISEKLRDHLDSSKASTKHFFANNDPDFLLVVQIDSDDYLAKITESGASLEDLSNMCLNLKSMLKIICPRFLIRDDSIKIYAHAYESVKIYDQRMT